MGTARLRLGDHLSAEALFREALEIWRVVLGRHVNVATALNNLGSTLERQGKLAEAELAYRESLELKRQLFDGDHQTIAVGLNNLGQLLAARGRLAEAEPLLVESHAMRARLRGPRHPEVAQAAHTLAELYERRGDHRRAVRGFGEALAIRRETLGDTAAATRASDSALAHARARLRGRP